MTVFEKATDPAGIGAAAKPLKIAIMEGGARHG